MCDSILIHPQELIIVARGMKMLDTFHLDLTSYNEKSKLQ